MKIQCDVCNRDEASVFCSADEAALCNACDHRVHHANKLASKHHRFSLLHPSPKQFPLCDICQEKRAFLFCQQDRAILCRDCDVPIHKANEHTKKHNRFLLTGVKLSTTSELYIPTTTTTTGDDSLTNGCDSSSAVPVPGSKSQPSTTKKPPVSDSSSSQIYHPPSMSIETTTSTTSTTVNNNNNNNNHPPLKGGHDVGSTSSISEYLIETLPGWHVEDFLDSSSGPFGFSKSGGGDGVMSFSEEDTDFGSNNLSCFSSENIGVWVPQAPSSLITQDDQYSSYLNNGSSISIIGFKESKEAPSTVNNMKVAAANTRWCDDAFTVPQISPPSSTTGSKRSRTFW